MLWTLFTVTASAGQVIRNALQRDLIDKLGVVGATHVRFLFGFPFALVFLALMHGLTGEAIPEIQVSTWAITGVAAFAQIGATGLMLKAMHTKSFVVATAYTKTEPVLVAFFGFAFLGESLSPLQAVAIGLATSGVLLTAWPRQAAQDWSLAALGFGVLSAAWFAISAIGFRAGIHSLPSGGFGIRASTVLAMALFMQAFALSAFLALTDRRVLVEIAHNWRASLVAGFIGAAASQCWFLAFALASAAKVRTLALIEVIFARIVSGRMFRETPSPREGLGLMLIIAGVALLLNA